MTTCYYSIYQIYFSVRRETRVNEIRHSHLIRKIDVTAKQVETKLQPGLDEFKQSKPDMPQS